MSQKRMLAWEIPMENYKLYWTQGQYSSNIRIKALNREVEPYGFFLVKAPRKYYHALGRVLLPIAPCLFR